MKVNWYIQSWEGAEASLTAFIEEMVNSPYAEIDNEGDGFKAVIKESMYSNPALMEKFDNSLLELMNWVEEELKFRWSHSGI